MTAWLSVLVPLLVMFFALGMERVESRLRESTVRQDELDEMLEQPRPDEVRALFRSGTGRALELFRRTGSATAISLYLLGTCAVSLVAIALARENKGRTFEEIDAEYEAKAAKREAGA